RGRRRRSGAPVAGPPGAGRPRDAHDRVRRRVRQLPAPRGDRGGTGRGGRPRHPHRGRPAQAGGGGGGHVYRHRAHPAGADPLMSADPLARIEPGTVAILDRLARWDTTSIATIRSSYAAVAPPPTPPDPRVSRKNAVIPGVDGRPDVRVRWY